MLKLSIIWHAAVIVSTLNLRSE